MAIQGLGMQQAITAGRCGKIGLAPASRPHEAGWQEEFQNLRSCGRAPRLAD